MAIEDFPQPVDDQDPYVAEEQAFIDELSGDGVAVSSITITPDEVGPTQDPYVAQDFENGLSQQPATDQIQVSAADVKGSPATVGIAYDDEGNLMPGYTLDENNNPVYVGGGFVEPATQAQADADRVSALKARARQQQAIASQRKQANNGDWRVRLRLAPRSKYLYNAPQPGILQPLTVTDGVIFPYTPSITTAYKANYSQSDLTHSNYRGYFYGSSAVDPINITATFTAQDTSEANYLLAVIHFFRSATKMFYGQDAERGSPPPLVYLSGLGEYQFNEHSCVISSFSYILPADVDYIRAGSPGNIGTDLTTRRDRQSVATNGVFGSLNRLASAFLTKGALTNNPLAPTTLPLNNPTYVPTKMEIQITLLPVQSRNQVSKQFSVKEFANGNLLRGGFW